MLHPAILLTNILDPRRMVAIARPVVKVKKLKAV